VIPLNPDALFAVSLQFANTPVFVDPLGFLDASGRARARFVVPPGLLGPFVGSQFDFAYALLLPISFASNPVPVAIER
jgi:hypothetical protein